jgi:hypothetical protein
MLSAQDMRDIGAYFATQKAGAGVADDTVIADGPYKGMKFYEVGQKLYRGGDASPRHPGLHGLPRPRPAPAIPARPTRTSAARTPATRPAACRNTAPAPRHLQGPAQFNI